MSWYEITIGRHTAVGQGVSPAAPGQTSRGFIGLCTLAFAVVACGFQPLHGRQGDAAGGTPAAQLADVYISPIPNRIGQEVRNGLLDRLNTLDQPVGSQLRLDVKLTSRKEGLAIRSDETVTRFNFRLRALFRLIDTRSGETIFSGRTVSISAYNIVRSSFANVTAEKDAQSRAAREVSEEIHTQIAVYLKTREGR